MAGEFHWRRLGNWLVLVPFVFWLSSCTRSVEMGDPSLKPFASMYAVQREQYGMSPLPKYARVTIDRNLFGAKSRGYDVMLHIYLKAHRHLAFRLETETYKWVGEQEQCWGPREYHSVDGTFNESLAISYFHQVPGQMEGLNISYSGPDDSLTFRQVPISKAKELLKQWGCM